MATSAAPPGVNLADNQSPQILAGVITTLVLTVIALAVRLASTKIVGRRLTASDYLVYLGLAFSWTDYALVFYGKIGQYPPRSDEN